MLPKKFQLFLQRSRNMPAKIIDGTTLGRQVRESIKKDIQSLLSAGKRSPSLSVILVGDDPASQVYVKQKEKGCLDVGITSKTIKLPEKTSQEELHKVISELNHDKNIDGILLQLPIPKHLDRHKAIQLIDPKKDVDGLTPVNQGLLAGNLPGLRPCTPSGVMELIKTEHASITGKVAVVLGYSVLVGAPITVMLTQARATVIALRSTAKDPKSLTRQADILVVAAGSPHLVDDGWIKPGVTIIDVGIHRTESGKLCGDVKFDSVHEKAGAITPVPGGVGPMTIAMLLKNCLQAFQNNN